MHSGTRHRIDVFSLGGTITSLPLESGGGPVGPTLSGREVLSTLARDAAVDFVFHELDPKPSNWLAIEDVLALSAMVETAAGAGSAGALVIQGTDTMEETGFLLELSCSAAVPIAVTGAMRGPSELSADGQANLASAIGYLVQAEAATRVVVMNDEIHPARFVRKDHTTRVDSFASGPQGPEGLWVEERFVEYRTPLPKPEGLDLASAPERKVLLIKAALGDTLDWLVPILDRFQGIVVEAMGGGHLHRDATRVLVEACARVPVVVTSRCHGGPLLRQTYGYEGSEVHLLKAGIHLAALDSLKARLALSLVPAELPAAAALERFARIESALGLRPGSGTSASKGLAPAT
ncbi:asparaginase [Arthrobacter ginkgonis]|uniref:Asparaginase n=1 Tax=Arthrobacter ginkgonis TaxID=1630594 RepID=A0ABP7CXS5_9MICC